MNTHKSIRFPGLLLSLALCLLHDSSAAAQQSSKATEKTGKEAPGKVDHNDSDEVAGDAEPARRIIRIIGDTKLDVRQWPLLGKPDAKYVFVEMFDYTCPHCRDMHQEIDAALERFGDDLAVLTLPVPLNASCNNQVGRTEFQHRESCEIANFAVTVWRLKPKKYHAYHDWLFEPNVARTAAVSRKRAVEIVGEEPLKKALSKRVPQKYIASHVKLYAKAGAGSIPKMLFPNITLVGNVGSAKLCETIESELGNH
jgi:protein-disulfide isomerase